MRSVLALGPGRRELSAGFERGWDEYTHGILPMPCYHLPFDVPSLGSQTLQLPRQSYECGPGDLRYVRRITKQLTLLLSDLLQGQVLG